MTKEQAKIGQLVLYRVEHQPAGGVRAGTIQRVTEGGHVLIGYEWHRLDHVTIAEELPAEPAPEPPRSPSPTPPQTEA